MKYFLHPQAKEELEQAIIFYKKQQAGLEIRFIEAVALVLETNRALAEEDLQGTEVIREPFLLVA